MARTTKRNFRKKSWSKPRRRKTTRGPKQSSLKERLLTVAIWALSLINIVLIASLVSDFFASPHETPASINLPAEGEEAENSPAQAKIVTVEVLNACGVQGLAHKVTEFLRAEGFDVVSVGNYEGGFNIDKTLVIDRMSMSAKNASKVARALGVKDDFVEGQLERSVQLDVTVLIGKDYRSLPSYDEIMRLSQR